MFSMRQLPRIVAALWLSCCTTLAVTAPVSTVLQAENFSALQGVTLGAPQDQNPRVSVNGFGSGCWIRFDSVSFLDGEYDSLSLYYWSSWPQSATGATVRARIDSPTGTAIASFTSLSGTVGAGYGPSQRVAAVLAPVSGTHRLFVTFDAGGSNVCDLDKIQLSGTATADVNAAKTYYVSTNGNDQYDGLDVNRPFKTIQKAASLMKPGSRCLIRQGIYRETVRPAYTGIAGAPLSFEAYSGENVVINGAEPVTGWTVHQGSIYKAPMTWTMGRYNDQVLVDGKMAWVARSPNVDENYQPHDWLSYTGVGVYNWKPWQNELEPVAIPSLVAMGANGSQWGGSGDAPTGAPFDMDIQTGNDVTNSGQYALPSTLFNRPADFFKGGLIQIRNYYWASVGEITGSTSTATTTVLNATKTSSMWRDWQDPGYISYVFALLDAPNEWYRQDSTLYLWAPDGGNPTGHLVEAKKRMLGFDLRGKQFVNLTGIRMIATSMTLEDASNCIIDKCHFKYVSHFDSFEWYDVGPAFWNSPFNPSDGHLGIYISGSNTTVKNSSVIGSAGSGIIIGGKYNTVTNCRIHSCDYADTYNAGILFMRRYIGDPQDGIGNIASHNSIKGCSRGDIEVGQAATPTAISERTRIEYNDLGLAAYASNETGTIDGIASQQVEVHHNWFHDAAHPQNGHIATQWDFGARAWIQHHNVMWRGTSLVQGGYITGWHWMLAFDDTVDQKCYNNTVIDRCEQSRADIDTGWPPFISRGGLAKGAFNNIYARDDTATWKFTDAKNNDYSLRAGSPAIDKGKVLPGLVETYQGSAPDLGAYEFGEPRWVAGADWQEQPWVYPPPNEPGMISRPLPGLSQGAAATIRLAAGKLVMRGPAGSRLSIFDARGAVVRQSSVGSDGAGTVDERALPAGIYMVRLSSNRGSLIWRVMMK